MNRKRALSAGAAVATAITAVVVPADTPVDAHQSPLGHVFWNDAIPHVGTGPSCAANTGQTSGGAVRGIQTIMWASGGYGYPTRNYKN